MKKILFLLLLLYPAASFADKVVYPLLTGPVTDTAGKLTASQNKSISDKILALQKEKGSQIAVCIIESTSPLTIEQYGITLAQKWKIGRAKIDDGVIIIVAMRDRKMRIEVGRGLEGAVTDLVAGRIVDRIMAPSFKKGDFYGGIDRAVDALASLIRGEDLPALNAADYAGSTRYQETFTTRLTIGLILLIGGFFIYIILVGLGKYIISLIFFDIVFFAGLYLAGAGTIGESFVYTLFGTVPAVIIALAVKYGGVSSGSSGSSYSSYSSGSSDSSSYSSSSSSDSSSSSSSSSSDSSSYSGGGGDYGGGGASGSW